jgi:hypothetical protein
MLEDMAVLTRGQTISDDLGINRENVTLDMLGRAKRVRIEKENTTIIEGAGNLSTSNSSRRKVYSEVRRLWCTRRMSASTSATERPECTIIASYIGRKEAYQAANQSKIVLSRSSTRVSILLRFIVSIRRFAAPSEPTTSRRDSRSLTRRFGRAR